MRVFIIDRKAEIKEIMEKYHDDEIPEILADCPEVLIRSIREEILLGSNQK